MFFGAYRTNIANWTIKLGQRLEKLLDLLKQAILSGTLINLDETIASFKR
ncbi:MAG: transposase [SAR324 cluster bacterium]|nr:transposase [SAR324 cluster bacterium]